MRWMRRSVIIWCTLPRNSSAPTVTRSYSFAAAWKSTVMPGRTLPLDARLSMGTSTCGMTAPLSSRVTATRGSFSGAMLWQSLTSAACTRRTRLALTPRALVHRLCRLNTSGASSERATTAAPWRREIFAGHWSVSSCGGPSSSSRKCLLTRSTETSHLAVVFATKRVFGAGSAVSARWKVIGRSSEPLEPTAMRRCATRVPCGFSIHCVGYTFARMYWTLGVGICPTLATAYVHSQNSSGSKMPSCVVVSTKWWLRTCAE
mmetsp:Transcript_43540/g.134454  ORF Transcript_43540/g.134454 Transcript_43540/m.134454 type:complete len:261 (-) Transcript_43540:384-1166(-)